MLCSVKTDRRRVERTINSSWCDANKTYENSLIPRAFHSADISFPLGEIPHPPSPPEFSLLLFSPAISVRKWAMSIRELCGQKRLVFFWSANRTVIVAQQSSQMQDIKGRLRSSTSGSAIHRIIVAVVQPDLLILQNICCERKLSCCKMDVTRWGIYVQFREAY